MRHIVRRNFRELLRPRLRQCRHTRESVKWINRLRTKRWWQTLHLTLVNMALSSKELICSLTPVHRQPERTFHRQRREGTVARSLWYLTSWFEGVVNRMSSPLILIKLQRLSARVPWSWDAGTCCRGFNGRRKSFACNNLKFVGLSLSMMYWGECAWMKPRGAKSWPKNQATTGTDQELPSKVNLVSLTSTSFLLFLGRQLLVYPTGNPNMYSRSSASGRRHSFLRLIRQLRWAYWYGGNL